MAGRTGGGPPPEKEAGPEGPATVATAAKQFRQVDSSGTCNHCQRGCRCGEFYADWTVWKSRHDEPVSVQLRRRRTASQRMPRLSCGRADPLPSRHSPGPRPYGYRLAAEHLAERGYLPAPPDDLEQLRQLWRDGDRELAGEIASAWGLVR